MAFDTTEGELRGSTALTIAGFDPGSGAGITADLLTFSKFGMFATAAITALTVQSTRGVRRSQSADPGLLRDTLDELEADLPARGIKIGMLGGAPQVQVVIDFITTVRRRRPVTVVVDPVLLSSSGAVLLDRGGVDRMRSGLLPLADAVTPNTPEAALLAGLPCENAADAELCAAALGRRYPGLTPIITGGHLEPPRDLVWLHGEASWIAGERIRSKATHGTGCVFSSALLASYLATGDWSVAALRAKRFVASAIQTAEPRGSGSGPLHLLAGPALRP